MKQYAVPAAIILFLVIVAVFITRLDGKPDIPLTGESVAQMFGAKYGRPSGDFIIEIVKDDGSFARGSVIIRGERGNAIWFAANTRKGWRLASDGQGPMSCEIANEYKFPKEMVPGCLDMKKGKTFVER